MSSRGRTPCACSRASVRNNHPKTGWKFYDETIHTISCACGRLYAKTDYQPRRHGAFHALATGFNPESFVFSRLHDWFQNRRRDRASVFRRIGPIADHLEAGKIDRGQIVSGRLGGDGAYTYGITGAGILRAREAMERSQYATPSRSTFTTKPSAVRRADA